MTWSGKWVTGWTGVPRAVYRTPSVIRWVISAVNTEVFSKTSRILSPITKQLTVRRDYQVGVKIFLEASGILKLCSKDLFSP